MFQPHEWRHVSLRRIDAMISGHQELLARAESCPEHFCSPGDIHHHKTMIETLKSLRPYCKGKD